MHYLPYMFHPGYSHGYQTGYPAPEPNRTMTPAGMELKDYGSHPFVININEATKRNHTFRTTLWTGNHLQVALMSLKPGEDIGLEVHPHVDQFLRIEQGQGVVQMGNRRDNLTFRRRVFDDSAIFVPAGTWHNITNTSGGPLKLYTIYAPPNHPFGTVHRTKAEAMAMEHGRHSSHFSMPAPITTFW